MRNYHSAHQMLICSTCKLIQIFNKPEWKNELLEKAPPVLWFGNSNSSKNLILTLGANPSDKEFLEHNKNDKINYLQAGKQRFRHLKDDENFTTILQSDQLRDEIIQSYNEYFSKNPYTKWFGNNTAEPYNLEGFLRGIDASFYDNTPTQYQACHIDIFPFATRSDFTTIEKKLIKPEFLHNGWSKNYLIDLLNFFQPKFLIVIGKNNVQTFCEIFQKEVNVKKEFDYRTISGRSTKLYHIDFIIPTIGIHLNLGNPRGFNKEDLYSLGIFIKENLLV